MSSYLFPKSALTTQEQTPNSSHIFSASQKLQVSQQLSCFSKSQQCLQGCQNPEQSRKISPFKKDQSQIISEGSLSKTMLKPNLNSNSGSAHDSGIWTIDSTKLEGAPIRAQSYYSKDVIREEEEEIRQLRKWVEVLKKQCKMYEQVISKLDQKIIKLTKQNQSLTTLLKLQKAEHESSQKSIKILQLQNAQKMNKIQENHKNQISNLKQKVNKVMEMYNQLQSDYNKSQIQWNVWKQKWNTEKQRYVQHIQQLKDFIDKNQNYGTNQNNCRTEIQDIRARSASRQEMSNYQNFYGKIQTERDWNQSPKYSLNKSYERSRNNSQYSYSGSKY